MAMSCRSALFLSQGWLKSALVSVVMSIRNGFSLPFCSLALYQKGHVSSTSKWTLHSRRDHPSAWWSTRLWVRELHPVFVQDMAWRLAFCPQPLPWHIPPTSFVALCDPRLLPKASLHRGPSIVSSCVTPRNSTNAMTPFSRAPLNLTIALFIAALSWIWRSCRSFFPRCAWRARGIFDWTRGTTPMHTPPTPRLVWLSSFSLSPYRPSYQRIFHCFRCPTPPPPRTPLSHPPFPSPALCPPPPLTPVLTCRVPIPLPWGSSSAARAAHELPTASFIWLLLALVATVFSSSMRADAMGYSGSRSRRDGRFPQREAATTRPRTRAWQPIYTATLMELLLVSSRPPSRIGRWAYRRASCPR